MRKSDRPPQLLLLTTSTQSTPETSWPSTSSPQTTAASPPSPNQPSPPSHSLSTIPPIPLHLPQTAPTTTETTNTAPHHPMITRLKSGITQPKHILDLQHITEPTTDILWLRRLLPDFGAPVTTSTVLQCDNTSAIALASNPIFHARTKHVEIDFHFLRDHIYTNQLKLQHIPTLDQITDIFTKPHPTTRFLWLHDKLTVQSMDPELAGG